MVDGLAGGRGLACHSSRSSPSVASGSSAENLNVNAVEISKYNFIHPFNTSTDVAYIVGTRKRVANRDPARTMTEFGNR